MNIGPLELQECVGIGGMGEVWRGWTARPVALRSAAYCHERRGAFDLAQARLEEHRAIFARISAPASHGFNRMEPECKIGGPPC